MVGESDWTGNTLFDGVVFAHYNGRKRVGKKRQTKNQKCGVVSQRSGDLFGRNRLREAANMGETEFSNIGK